MNSRFTNFFRDMNSERRKLRKRLATRNQAATYDALEPRQLLAAVADSYDFVNRTEMQVHNVEFADRLSVKNPGNVFSNDTVGGTTIVSIDTTNTIGTVDMAPGGTFTYDPGPRTWDLQETDRFSYTDSLGTTAVVTLRHLTSIKVSYVDPTAVDPGDGTSLSPYNNFELLKDNLIGSERVYVDGDVSFEGITLPDSVILNGTGYEFGFGAVVIAEAGIPSTLTDTSGLGITLGNYNYIRGLHVDSLVSDDLDNISQVHLENSVFEQTIDLSHTEILSRDSRFKGSVVATLDSSKTGISLFGDNNYFESEVFTNGITVLSDATFSDQLTLRPAENGWAIRMSFGAPNEVQILGGMSIEPQVAGTFVNGIKVGPGDSLTIKSPTNPVSIDITNPNGPTGQAILVDDSFIDFEFDKIDAGLGSGAAISIVDSNGNFVVKGSGDVSFAGNSSGGTITARHDALGAMEFLGFDGGIKLNNIELRDNLAHAIFMVDVNDFELTYSSLSGNGDARFDNSIYGHDLSGSFQIWGSLIQNTSGFSDVHIQKHDSARLTMTLAYNVIGGRADEYGTGVLISAFDSADIVASVFGNRFVDSNGDHFFARANGSANLKVYASYNLLTEFDANGFVFLQNGNSNADFQVFRNTIIGKQDSSSSFAVYSVGTATELGAGSFTGNVYGHGGNNGEITNTKGLMVMMLGREGRFSYGHFGLSHNTISNNSSLAGISVIVHGGNANYIIADVINNTIRMPGTTTGGLGIRFVAGLDANTNQSGTIWASIFDNEIEEGILGYGIYLVDRSDDLDLRLKAPADSPLRGQSFLDSDGGVLEINGNELLGEGILPLVLGEIKIS